MTKLKEVARLKKRIKLYREALKNELKRQFAALEYCNKYNGNTLIIRRRITRLKNVLKK